MGSSQIIGSEMDLQSFTVPKEVIRSSIQAEQSTKAWHYDSHSSKLRCLVPILV